MWVNHSACVFLSLFCSRITYGYCIDIHWKVSRSTQQPAFRVIIFQLRRTFYIQKISTITAVCVLKGKFVYLD